MTRYAEFDHEAMSDALEQAFATRVRRLDELPGYSFCSKDLLHEGTREAILHEQATQQGLELGGAGSTAVGTLFAKRYSVMIMAVISAFTMYDALLHIEEGGVRIELNGAGGMWYETWLERYVGVDAGANKAADFVHREKEVRLLRERLHLHLHRVFQSVADATGASVKVMNSLVAHNVQQLAAHILHDPSIYRNEQRLVLVKHDMNIWLEQQKENIFGSTFQCFEHFNGNDAPLLIRRYCCLAYKIGDGHHAHSYCNSCPKLDSESRLRQWINKGT
ncbi:(2Fe-2S)-binding protein [Paenibacillus silvae]|uniref:Ferric siderophore reductase C-terminal domain-containing protein n=1 Tax=Paenibacillus silvae TaxID=1325358 RepID=A0A2W6P3K6_9BACL|nr:(2Fe-2S)-binding protein [Paenibacillus silvae]PZT52786.1 hypothetical protein DN757_25605 [Paenibacillus silvae]